MAASYEWIADDASLDAFLRRASGFEWIGFDTEFVSEYSYHPQWCLGQLSTPQGITLVDPLGLHEPARFWQWLAAFPGRVIVHAGRAEYDFCLRFAGEGPRDWFDIQIAAGLVGTEYPLSLRRIVETWTRNTLGKGETRTDWRRRPLSRRQLEYACQDVRPLKNVHDALRSELRKRDRERWYAEEIEAWRRNRQADWKAVGWHRLSGAGQLSGRQRAVAKALWEWREDQARRQNILPRRVLRDDLIIELAKWESPDPKRVRTLRGMEWRRVARKLGEICRVIDEALQLPPSEWPELPANSPRLELANQLPQFLYMAISSVCIEAGVAPSLAATVHDVRELIAHHLHGTDASTSDALPRLARGWRAALIGCVVEDLLAGKLAIRIDDPWSDHPITIEAHRPDAPSPGA